MSYGSGLKTIGMGALLAAVVGCMAGSYLRPHETEARPGMTLVVSKPAEPELYYAYTPTDEHGAALY